MRTTIIPSKKIKKENFKLDSNENGEITLLLKKTQ